MFGVIFRIAIVGNFTFFNINDIVGVNSCIVCLKTEPNPCGIEINGFTYVFSGIRCVSVNAPIEEILRRPNKPRSSASQGYSRASADGTPYRNLVSNYGEGRLKISQI